MNDRPLDTPFECIDPAIGSEIWRLEQPELDPRLHQELTAHVSVCHACRVLLNLDAKTREMAQSGKLESPEPVSRGQRLGARQVRVAWSAGLALAACLTVMLLSTPRPISDGLIERGTDPVRFLRPVEGEILSTTRPLLRWTPITGASRYFVEIRDSDGKSLWEGESPKSEIRVPEDASLVRGRAYKALLSTRPADLVQPGQTSVVFRSDSLWRTALHRLRWAHPILQGLAGLAAALTLLVAFRRPRA